MKRVLSSLVAVVLLVGPLQLASPTFAATPTKPQPTAPGALANAPAYDPTVPAPGPNDLTWAQVEAQEATTTNSFAAPTTSFKDGASTSGVTPFPGASGQSCTISTGDVYKRASGGIYPYGAVGGKPLTQCTVIMARIEQTTNIYKTVWWGLQQVAGPFTAVNYGEGRLQQTNPIRKCDDLRETTFRMIVRSTGTFPTGVRGTASAFEEATLKCGTN